MISLVYVFVYLWVESRVGSFECLSVACNFHRYLLCKTQSWVLWKWRVDSQALHNSKKVPQSRILSGLCRIYCSSDLYFSQLPQFGLLQAIILPEILLFGQSGPCYNKLPLASQNNARMLHLRTYIHRLDFHRNLVWNSILLYWLLLLQSTRRILPKHYAMADRYLERGGFHSITFLAILVPVCDILV